MRRHLAYLKYVLLHKWYIFVIGIFTGVPLIQLIKHDWTKFTSVEWVPYAHTFYNKDGSKNEDRQSKHKDFEKAWIHHYNHNKHHWQYWVPRKGKPKEMPVKYRREMMADWMAVSKAKTGSFDCFIWYLDNRSKMSLHHDTMMGIEKELSSISEEIRHI